MKKKKNRKLKINLIGPHREMAVDVPDSFIARNKTPPRYPPPQRNQTQVNFFFFSLKNLVLKIY